MMEAKLFAIRCGINQAVNIPNVKQVIVITDAIHAAKQIFDLSSYPYQVHAAAISKELRSFFNQDPDNCIDFWDCPSKINWPLHSVVDKETKENTLAPALSHKSSWDFYSKQNSNSILALWRISFQVLDFKGKQFLELFDDNFNHLKLSSVKGGL